MDMAEIFRIFGYRTIAKGNPGQRPLQVKPSSYQKPDKSLSVFQRLTNACNNYYP